MQLLVLKDKVNSNDVITPQNSRVIKKNPQKLTTTFESLLSNDNVKSSASKIKSNAFNTPVHGSVSRLATTPRQISHYESHLTNSAVLKRTQGSSIKKPQIQSAKLPQKTAVYNHAPVMNTTITFSKPTFDVNPIVNGVDYSDMIARKAELGYSGPGYIVEFNCDPKYIRGIIIQKGFWKLTTDTNYEPDQNCTDIGPAMYFHRIDKQENRLTPGKTLTNYEFNWRPRFIQPEEKAFHDTTQTFDLETSQPKAKKSLKWASNLEDVKENSFKLSPQVIITATNSTSSPIHSAEIKRKLRRSFSHNEILGLTKVDKHQNYSSSSKHDDYSLNLPSCPKFDLNDLSVTTDENKENLLAGTSSIHLDSVSSHGLNLSEINSINKNDSQSSSLTNTTTTSATTADTTPPTLNNDLNSVLKDAQTIIDMLKRMNETELNLKSNSTFEILKMTNSFSLIQDYAQKFKDKILINSFSK